MRDQEAGESQSWLVARAKEFDFILWVAKGQHDQKWVSGRFLSVAG